MVVGGQMSNMVLSIVFPMYNVGTYLNDLLFELKKISTDDVELVFVDDGSSDKSAQMVLDAIRSGQIPGGKLFTKDNGGLSDARNYGLQRASGEYVWFVDPDDIVLGNQINTLVHSVLKKEEADLVLINYLEFIDGEKPYSVDTGTVAHLKKVNSDTAIINLLSRKIDSHSWEYIAKRKTYTDHNVQFPVGRNFEDYATTYKVFLSSRIVVRFVNTLYYYRQREGSIVRNSSLMNKNALDILIITREILQNVESFGNYKSEMCQYCLSFLLTALEFIDSRSEEESKRLASEIDMEIRKIDQTGFPWRKKAVLFLYRIGFYRVAKRVIRRAHTKQ